MRKKYIYRDIITLLISTLITILAWVGFEVYRAYTKSEVPGDIDQYLENLDPKLKEEVMTRLENRKL